MTLDEALSQLAAGDLSVYQAELHVDPEGDLPAWEHALREGLLGGGAALPLVLGALRTVQGGGGERATVWASTLVAGVRDALEHVTWQSWPSDVTLFLQVAARTTPALAEILPPEVVEPHPFVARLFGDRPQGLEGIQAVLSRDLAPDDHSADDDLWIACGDVLQGPADLERVPGAIGVYWGARYVMWEAGNGGLAQVAFNAPWLFWVGAWGLRNLGRDEAAAILEAQQARVEAALPSLEPLASAFDGSPDAMEAVSRWQAGLGLDVHDEAFMAALGDELEPYRFLLSHAAEVLEALAPA